MRKENVIRYIEEDGSSIITIEIGGLYNHIRVEAYEKETMELILSDDEMLMVHEMLNQIVATGQIKSDE